MSLAKRDSPRTANAAPMLYVVEAEGTASYEESCGQFARGEPVVMDETAWREGIHPDDRARVLAGREAAWAAQSDWQTDYRWHHHDDEYRLVWDRAQSRRGAQGEFKGWLGLLVDVEEQRRIEEAVMLARSEAGEASRLKAEFLANLSHEIRTPMNGIIGMAGLLLDTPLDPEQRELADIVQQSADALLGVINDILDYSRLEAGRLPLVEVDFDVDVQIEEALALLADAAAEKRLELVADLPMGHAVRRRGDPGRVRQVLMQLVGNAIKFTDRGEVVVRLTALRADRLLLEVSDTGPGIPAEWQTRIFEPFVQGDGSSTRRYAGTGLGLALVRRLVTLMGGRIGVVSGPGQGARFWVELPLPPATRQEESDEIWVPADLRVLLVEPVESQRRVLARQLREYALVEAVLDAAAARAQVAAGRFHAVLLARTLPGDEHLDLMRAWREDAGQADLRILLLGHPGDLPDMPQLREAGADVLLIKPVRRLQLRRTLSRLLAAPGGSDRGEPEVAPTPVRLAAGAGSRVLVVEDNLVNQKVAARYLERLGHEVDFAGNGGEALELLAMQRYDVVLMDGQMPVVDGFEVTRRIRAGEVVNLPADVVIVGLTAYAHDEDRDRWLAAGVNDILAKPLRFEEVQAVLERQRLRRVEEAADDGQGRVLDEDQFNELRELQDEESPTFLTDMIDLFVRETPERRVELIAALEEGDVKRVTQLAHTIKGASANFGGRRLQRLCRRMEEQGKAGLLPEVRKLLPQFDRELMALMQALERQKQRMISESTRG